MDRDAIEDAARRLEEAERTRTEGEPVFFCIPAPSIDKENDTVYHEGIVSGILRKLGYTPHSMNEGHAVVYSSLADQDFTGIGVSCSESHDQAVPPEGRQKACR